MSLKRHHHDSVVDACTSAVGMVFGSALTLAPFVLIVVVARFIGPIYLTFLKAVTTDTPGLTQFTQKVKLQFVIQTAWIS